MYHELKMTQGKASGNSHNISQESGRDSGKAQKSDCSRRHCCDLDSHDCCDFNLAAVLKLLIGWM